MKNNYLAIIIIILFISSNYLFAQNQPVMCVTDEYNRNLERNDPQRAIEINLKKKSFNGWKKSKSYHVDKTIIIPVVFHIVHNGEALGSLQNPYEKKIQQQLQILNDFFANKNNKYTLKGVDTKIQFCLATRNIQGISRKGVIRYKGVQEKFIIYDEWANKTNDDLFLKSQHRNSYFPRENYLNIWVANLFSKDITGEIIEYSGGYSTFPWEISPILDGIVVSYKHFGIQTSKKFGLGKTLIHEAGHWLGLYHTFQDSFDDCFEDDCSSEGDKVCDTEPRQIGAFTDDVVMGFTENNCFTAESCVNGGESTDAIQNYMDYNFDPCMTFFTQGQKERMKDALSWYRPDIYNENTPPVGCTAGVNPDGDDGSTGNTNNSDDGLGYHQFATFHKTGSKTVLNDKWLFTHYGYEIHIKKRVGCESQFHQYFSVGLAGYDQIIGEKITLIDNNTFAIVASKYQGLPFYQVKRDILIYKNFNDHWSLQQTIPLGNNSSSLVNTPLSYNNGKLAVIARNVTIHDAFSSSLTTVAKVYTLNNNTFNFYTQFNINPNYRSIQVDIYGNLYFYDLRYSNSNGEKIHFYKEHSNGNYYSIKTYNFPGSNGSKYVKKWLTKNGKLYVWFVSRYHNTNYTPNEEKIQVFEKTKSYPLRFSESGTAWEKVEDFDLNDAIGFSNKVTNFDVYNDILIFAVHVPNYHFLRFLKKDGNNRKSVNLNLYEINSKDLRKPCKALYKDYGTTMVINANDLLVSGGILYKLPQLLGEANTSQICGLQISGETFGYNIEIGGECSTTYSNIYKTISASKSIILKPGTTITNSNFIAKIQPNSSLCNVIHVGNRYACNTTAKNSKTYKHSEVKQEKVTTSKKLNIYPNPNNGIFYINTIEEINRVQVYNMVGQLLLDKNPNGNNEIKMPIIKKGIYNLILYKSDGEKKSIKVIIR